MYQTIVTLTAYLAASSLGVALSLSAPEAVDVGRLSTNEVGKFEFKVKNDSGEALDITDIKTSCSCTNVELQGTDTLAPGEGRTVTGNVNFGSKIGRYETKALIAFKSKNGKPEEKIVRIQGKVVAAMVLDKPRIDFGKVDLSDAPREIIVEARRGNSGEEWDSLSAESDSDALTVNVRNETKDRVRVSVKLDPATRPIATLRSTVKLALLRDDKRLDETYELPVSARITGPMEAKPASVYLGVAKPSSLVKKSISLSSETLDLRKIMIENAPSGCAAAISQADKGSATLDLQIELPSSAGALYRVITLKHEPSGLRVTLPIVGVVARKL